MTKNANSNLFNPIAKLFSNNWNQTATNPENNSEENEEEGHLIIDMYEKDNSYYIIAPAAGVHPDDIEIELNDNFIVIKGKRQKDTSQNKQNYLVQECYWGSFLRQVDFPTQVDSEKAAATFKDGMLTICIPKTKSAQTKTLKVKTL